MDFGITQRCECQVMFASASLFHAPELCIGTAVPLIETTRNVKIGRSVAMASPELIYV